MHKKRDRLKQTRLYVLVTEKHCRRPWREVVQLALEGGADAIQLREKELPHGLLLGRACDVRDMTLETDALFIVNDRADIAVLSGADGVHIGQDDLPPEQVRKLVGRDVLIGLSTHTVEQAAAAADRGADYVGVGPYAPTETKGLDYGYGPELVQAVREATDIPFFAIGGITVDDAGPAMSAGATGIAVCGAVCGAEDPCEAAAQLKAAVEQAGR